jgi:type I restriction enzyme S subunit
MMTSKDSWPEVRIGDLGDIFTGRTPPTEQPDYFGGDYPFITPGDMRQGKYARLTQRSVSNKGAELLRRIKIPANSVCVSCIGWQMGEVIMTDKPSFTNQQINTIVPNDKVDPSYLYYSLRPRKQEWLSLGAATGVRTPILNKSAFCDLKVRIPTFPVQRRIADILSAYDNLMENSQRRIQVLESMARAIYRQRFVGAANSTFGALCELVKEPFDEREHSDRPLLDLARMPQRTIAPAETGKASELTTSRILFEPGDTLFGAIRCYLHKVLAAHYPGVTNTSVLVLRPKKANFRSLVVLIASDTDTIRWADTHSTGTKMPVINWGVFQTMPAPLPSELSAREFENVAGPMLEQIGILANQIQNLRRTRDLLLPRLLSGQIENLVCPTE